MSAYGAAMPRLILAYRKCRYQAASVGPAVESLCQGRADGHDPHFGRLLLGKVPPVAIPEVDRIAGLSQRHLPVHGASGGYEGEPEHTAQLRVLLVLFERVRAGAVCPMSAGWQSQKGVGGAEAAVAHDTDDRMPVRAGPR